MRKLILVEIHAFPSKEADEGRYIAVKRRLANFDTNNQKLREKDIKKKFNLDTFDYELLTDEQLLSIYSCFLICYCQQR